MLNSRSIVENAITTSEILRLESLSRAFTFKLLATSTEVQ